MIINNNVFDILRKKSKDYYALFISKKAQFSKNSLVLKRDFNLNEDQLEKVFLMPHIVCSEPYVKAFQCKVLNSILYTNAKLHKIGFIPDNKCSFCKFEPETLRHLLFDCVYSKLFWKDFEFYFYSLSKKNRSPQSARFINRYYNFRMPLTELFTIDSQSVSMGLQKITNTT